MSLRGRGSCGLWLKHGHVLKPISMGDGGLDLLRRELEVRRQSCEKLEQHLEMTRPALDGVGL